MAQLLRVALTFCLFCQFASSFEVRKRNVLRKWVLIDSTGSELPQCCEELAAFPQEVDKPDEDELEVMYPTSRRYFGLRDEKEVMIRTTSFGCGKLGHQIWPSSLALCLYCSNQMMNNRIIQDQNVLELGAGCGLPSVVFRDVLGAASVVATDFWREEEEEFDKDRLVPEHWHKINLMYNVEGKKATVQRLDWHDPDSIRAILAKHPIDIVVGSDLIYYETDQEPLWNTLDILLKEGGVKEVVLVSSLSERRDALPAFLELLRAKGREGDYTVEMEEFTMHVKNTKEDGDRFIKMSVQRT